MVQLVHCATLLLDTLQHFVCHIILHCMGKVPYLLFCSCSMRFFNVRNGNCVLTTRRDIYHVFFHSLVFCFLLVLSFGRGFSRACQCLVRPCVGLCEGERLFNSLLSLWSLRMSSYFCLFLSLQVFQTAVHFTK